jgi:1-deoxy-D-xylulose-5-phosphate synthase
VTIPVHNLGLPDRYVEHGEHSALLSQCGLDARGIEASISKWLDHSDTQPRIAK